MSESDGESEIGAARTGPEGGGGSDQAQFDGDSSRGADKGKARSGLGVIVHSFFVIPLLIAVLAVLVIAGVSILSSESADALDYLADVRVGGQTRRWQAAFDLSTLLFDLSRKDQVPRDERFVGEMTLAFTEAGNDDHRVRQYLSQAMALTGDRRFVPLLFSALEDQDSDVSASFYLHALGFLATSEDLPVLLPYLKHDSARVRTSAVRTVGVIGDESVVPELKSLLSDEEPNTRWFAAIALAGLGSSAGTEVLMQLLDREYLSGFPNVDADEQSDIIEVAVGVSVGIDQPVLIARIRDLATDDIDPRVRRAATEALR